LDIIVVGGGIVGMATAWRLARDGHQVTVLDRAATPGQGTSYANGGQLSYSYVAPLADSAIWTQLPKLLTDAESPVRFRPSRDPFQYRWLLSIAGWSRPVAGSSTVLAMLMMHELLAQSAQKLADRGIELPVFASPTIPGVTLHDTDIIYGQYRERMIEAQQKHLPQFRKSMAKEG
jgi:glycine/D-amino acid oxidase-like deaminating enzyme